jgi:hypothetical protein
MAEWFVDKTLEIEGVPTGTVCALDEGNPGNLSPQVLSLT